MSRRRDLHHVALRSPSAALLLGILVLGPTLGWLAAGPYGPLLVIACAGGLSALLWLKLGPYRLLLIFVFVSHLLIWFLKLTSTVLPTQYVALLPTAIVGLLYLITALRLGNSGFRVPVYCLDILVFGFVLVSFVQVLNSHVTLAFGLRSFLRTAFFAGMYFVGRLVVTSQERAQAVVKLVALTVGISALYAISQSVFGASLEGSYSDVLRERSGEIAVRLSEVRSYGTLTSQAAFGVMSALGALCALAWLMASDGKDWWLALGSLLVTGIGLLVSGSRSSILGLAAGAAVVVGVGWLLRRRTAPRQRRSVKVKKRTIWAIVGLFVAVIVLILFLNMVDTPSTQNAAKRLRTISPVVWLRGEVMEIPNVQARIQVWQAIWQGIVERPILGYGTGILGGGSHREGVGDVNGQTTADNQYLELWGELGATGLLVFCSILLGAWFTSSRRWREYRSRTLAALVAGIACLFAVVGVGAPPLDMYPVNAFFWLILGIGVNLRQFNQDTIVAESS